MFVLIHICAHVCVVPSSSLSSMPAPAVSSTTNYVRVCVSIHVYVMCVIWDVRSMCVCVRVTGCSVSSVSRTSGSCGRVFMCGRLSHSKMYMIEAG
jgi:hypothetical protein